MTMTAPTTPPDVPSQESFEAVYNGKPMFDGAPAAGVPWDIRDAQPRIKELAAYGALRGDVLDIGCGLGENSIYLTQQGLSVTGLDFSPSAIEQAKQRAAAAGVTVDLQVADATKLDGWDARFDTVIDSAVYHCFDHDGHQQYAKALHRATRPGARWFIACFGDGSVNGIAMPFGVQDPEEINSVLSEANWNIQYFGRTTYLGSRVAFVGAALAGIDPEQMPADMRKRYQQPGVAEEAQKTFERLQQLDDDVIHMPFFNIVAERG